MEEYDENCIQVLEGLEAVRKRPGMYFGDVNSPTAVGHMIDEFVSNVIDLFLQGTCTEVRIVLDGDFIEVRDDGPGFPFEKTVHGKSLVPRVFEELHLGATAFGHAPHVHLHSLGGVGIAPINMLCDELHCSSWRHGELWAMSFEDGVLTRGPEVLEPGVGRGTRIRFKPSPQFLGVVKPDVDAVRERLLSATTLFAGFVAMLEVGGEEERFECPDGLASYLRMRDARAAPLFHLQHEDSEMILEAAASGHAEQTEWSTWCNGRPTRLHGHHRDAFAQALAEQGWTPAHAALHLACAEPRFASPTTDRLEDARADGLDAILREALANFDVGSE